MRNNYGNTQPTTKAGSYAEDISGKFMIVLLGASPLLILATGNPAGLLGLPMLLLIPLAFTETRRKSEQERREERCGKGGVNKAPTKKVLPASNPKSNLSPEDQRYADLFEASLDLSSRRNK